ncbi:MAG TPA: uracil-DNA glycosylase [Candidatus Manganitrophaceae bacterium]|nr:uracil-DNA glycosylase [Candidatus Manganitrophaceae bacterium]
MDLQQLNRSLRTDLKCPLHRLGKQPVPGEGPIDATLFIIGEAPGQEEERMGRPFVGSAGRLLNKILQETGLDRAAFYITNAEKFRPPENRKPKKEELSACRPYLNQELALVDPDWIVTLGAVAMEVFLKGPLMKIHGKIHEVDYEGKRRRILPTFHPAAAFRNPELKDKIEGDFRLLKKEMTKPYALE